MLLSVIHSSLSKARQTSQVIKRLACFSLETLTPTSIQTLQTLINAGECACVLSVYMGCCALIHFCAPRMESGENTMYKVRQTDEKSFCYPSFFVGSVLFAGRGQLKILSQVCVTHLQKVCKSVRQHVIHRRSVWQNTWLTHTRDSIFHVAIGTSTLETTNSVYTAMLTVMSPIGTFIVI